MQEELDELATERHLRIHRIRQNQASQYSLKTVSVNLNFQN